METLVVMESPAGRARVDAARETLEAIVAARPGITWGELATAAAAEAGPGLSGPMDGWLTSALRTVGRVGDSFTFGAATPALIGLRDIGKSTFNTKKVGDSLKEAGRGIFDDAFNRFLDALPFGIGKDFKTGYVVNRYWMIAALGVVAWFVFLRRR